MGKLVAIVEDEFILRENYADALRHQGYEVGSYAARRDALNAFRTRRPDLVIVDIGLGKEPEGGFELCRELRAWSNTLPIIFLTARDTDLDIISGLRLGADDYLSKEISLAHLMARVAALLRRVSAMNSGRFEINLLVQGALSLDPDRMTVCWNEIPIPLTVTEFWIVHALVKRIGHVKTRNQLMHEANIIVDDSTITSHVKRIRRKFEVINDTFDCIETIYGLGYRWASDR